MHVTKPIPLRRRAVRRIVTWAEVRAGRHFAMMPALPDEPEELSFWEALPACFRLLRIAPFAVLIVAGVAIDPDIANEKPC